MGISLIPSADAAEPRPGRALRAGLAALVVASLVGPSLVLLDAEPAAAQVTAPAWCSSGWSWGLPEDEPVPADEVRRCLTQLGSTNENVRTINNGLECSVVASKGTAGTALHHMDNEVWAGILGGFYDQMLEWLRQEPAPGGGLFGATCWVPPGLVSLIDDGTIEPWAANFNLRRAIGDFSMSCWSPGVAKSHPDRPVTLSTGSEDCFTWINREGDVTRIHFVTTLAVVNQLAEPEGALLRARLYFQQSRGHHFEDMSCVGVTTSSPIIEVPRKCHFYGLDTGAVELPVGIVEPGEIVLPNPPIPPGFIDPTLLPGCRKLNLVGDDLNSVTWAGGETVNFEFVPLVEGDVIPQAPAVLRFVLGTRESGERVEVTVVAMIPGEVAVTVPELTAPLKPSVSVEITQPDCGNVLWYDPSGEGGVPGIPTGRSSWDECMDGLDDTWLGEESTAPPWASWAEDSAKTIVSGIVCGVYTLFVPARGADYYLADARIRTNGTGVGDLYSVWTTGANVLRTLQISGRTQSQPAEFAVHRPGGDPIQVSIPSPSTDVTTVLRLGLSVLTLIGGGVTGLRMITKALSGGAAGPSGGGKGGGE